MRHTDDVLSDVLLKLMSSTSQALAALNALFSPAPPPVVASPDLPLNLDDSIAADAASSWDFVTYRWYRGVDGPGVVRIFRFQRGNSVVAWHELLRTQQLHRVDGPFRTQAQAQAGPKP